jgi:hypothetical protein
MLTNRVLKKFNVSADETVLLYQFESSQSIETANILELVRDTSGAIHTIVLDRLIHRLSEGYLDLRVVGKFKPSLKTSGCFATEINCK